MTLPTLSHLQFLILGMLKEGEVPGYQLRTMLAARALRKEGRVFYLLMSRLEKKGYIEGRFAANSRGKHHNRERRYRLTGMDSSRTTRPGRASQSRGPA